MHFGVNEIEILFCIPKAIQREVQKKNWETEETPYTLHFNRKSTIWNWLNQRHRWIKTNEIALNFEQLIIISFQRNAMSYSKSTWIFCLFVKIECFVVQTSWVIQKMFKSKKLINTWHSTFNIQHFDFIWRSTDRIWHMGHIIISIHHSCFMFPFPSFANILLLPVPGCAWLFLSCRIVQGT